MVVSLTTCLLGLTIAAMPTDVPGEARAELKAAGADPDEAQALSRLEALVKTYPAWELPRLEAAQRLLERGDGLDLIESYLEGARVVAPENPRVHYLWALLQQERGELLKAERSLQVALLLRADYDEARLRLAAVEMSLGQFDDAVEAFRAVAARQPEATAVKLGLASALDKAGKKQDAEKVLKAMLPGPAHIGAARKLSEIYRAEGRVREADAVMKGIDVAPVRKLRPLKPSRK